MSGQPTISTAENPGSLKMLRAMVGIGVLCSLLIVLTYEGTLPRIERLKAEALEQAIFKVVPAITQTSAFTYEEGSGFKLSDSKDGGQVVYAGYDDDGTLMGFAIGASGKGYADVIRMLYGYDPEKEQVVGFYVLESKETPGLGDKIEKDDDFQANFDGLDVSLNEAGGITNAIEPVKHGTKTNPWEVDAITGATISSRAVSNALAESTQKWVPLIKKHLEDFNTQQP